jgi:hypothetical protein
VSLKLSYLTIVFTLLCAGAGITEAAEANSPRTLRVDYLHTGSVDKELFALDEVVIEPLPWPGSLQQVVDTLD